MRSIPQSQRADAVSPSESLMDLREGAAKYYDLSPEFSGGRSVLSCALIVYLMPLGAFAMTIMTRPYGRELAALMLLMMARDTALKAQLDPHEIPRRPPLTADADTNSANDYFWYGMAHLAEDPERAAAAFYWAGRIDPSWADPVYSRSVALLLAQPYRLLSAYITQRRQGYREPRLRAIDSLAYLALLRNPWVNRRIDRILLTTWMHQETDVRDVPKYLRQENPELGAWLSYTEGKFEESAAEYATAIAQQPDDHQLQYLRALSFVALGRSDSALAAIRIALRLVRSSDSEGWSYVGHPFLEFGLGVLYERDHQLDSARAAYERALVDDLTFYPAHSELGSLRLLAGDKAGALAEFEQAATLAPHDAVTLYEFGMLSLAAGQAVAGVGLLERASEAEPFYVPTHFTLARVYDQSGFVDEAVREYRTFLSLAPLTMATQKAAVRQRLVALGVPYAEP
jgi:tetratricopeptide (TPR) repeat protein